LHSPQHRRGLDVQALLPIVVPEGLFFTCVILLPAIRFQVFVVQVHRQTRRLDSSHGHTDRVPGHAVGHLHTNSAQFGNAVVTMARKIAGPERDWPARVRWALYNEQLHIEYCSPNTVQVNVSREQWRTHEFCSGRGFNKYS